MPKKHGPGGDQKWKKHGFLPDSKVKKIFSTFELSIEKTWTVLVQRSK